MDFLAGHESDEAPGQIGLRGKTADAKLPPAQRRDASAAGKARQRHHADFTGDSRIFGIIGNRPGIGPVAVKNRSSLSEERKRFRLFVGEDAPMGDFTDNPVAHEAHRLDRARLIERAHQALFVPQGAAVAKNVFHHVTDEAFVLFELTGKADEVWISLAGKHGLGRFYQFGPGARGRQRIFF